MTSNSSAVNQRLRILSHSYRRHVLAILSDASTPRTVRDLTNNIVGQENTVHLHNVSSDDIKEVYLSLIHVHLPMLEDAHLIEYDPTRELIEEAHLSDVQPLLSELSEDQLESVH